MIGPLLWLIYLLIRIPKARCLVADDGLVPMVWCKHGFHRGRLNGAKVLSRNFLTKVVWGLNKLSKMLQETGTKARQSSSIERIQNISCFSIA